MAWLEGILSSHLIVLFGKSVGFVFSMRNQDEYEFLAGGEIEVLYLV